MSVTGTLTITTSDDPNFVVGQSVQLSIDNGIESRVSTVTVVELLEPILPDSDGAASAS